MGAGLTELATILGWLALAFAVAALLAMVLVALTPRRHWLVLLIVLCPVLALWPVVLAWVDRL